MSTFVALNIEPDEDSDDEIDDTKEIQIEEALRLYQTALKLHSQGPQSYSQAAEAYLALFNSEIFKYPESLSEPKRLELYGQPLDSEDNYYEDIARESTTVATTTDGTPSTLPQILYLAYKNHGQFLLDYLKDQIDSVGVRNGETATGNTTSKQFLIDTVAAALNLFAEALDRDDTGVELWRRTSRLGGILGSTRIARFCLEAVLDVNGEGTEDATEPLGLEEAFAAQELKDLLDILADELSESQPPLSTLKRRVLPTSLRKHSSLYTFLPTQAVSLQSEAPIAEISSEKRVLSSPGRTWAAVGNVILQHLIAEQQGIANFKLGTGMTLILPGVLPVDRKRTLSHGASSAVEFSRVPINTVQTVSNARSGSNGDGPMSKYGSLARGEAGLYDHDNSQISADAQVLQPGEDGQSSLTDALKGGETGPGEIELVQSNVLVHKSVDATCSDQVQFSPRPNMLTLPTRKRSSDAAGNQEPADGGRIRSKRIRARESVAVADAGVNEETTGIDLAKHVTDQLDAITRADHWMFEVVNGLFLKLGVRSLGSLDELRASIEDPYEAEHVDTSRETLSSRARRTAIQDLRQILEHWTDEKGNITGYGADVEDANRNIGSARNSGLTLFLEHSRRCSQKISTQPLLAGDPGLGRFQDSVNSTGFCINEVAFLWIRNLLLPNRPTLVSTTSDGVPIQESPGSTYTNFLWPEILKEAVVQILVGQDEYILKSMEGETHLLEARILQAPKTSDAYLYSNDDDSIAEMVQTIFELHLDVYASITNPSSEVDIATRILQRDRLTRWADLASHLLNLRPSVPEGSPVNDVLTFRYLWAATFFANMSEGVSREHVLLCLDDLKQLLLSAGSPVLELQNNAVMPEVSAAAAEREMSRLTTMDFFLSIFSTENGDSVSVIESLEPILDLTTALKSNAQETELSHVGTPKQGGDSVQDDAQLSDTSHTAFREYQAQANEMASFVQRGSASLRLFLWRRLRDAYEAINYPPKVFSCCARSIETVMMDLKSPTYLDSAPEHRQFTLLKGLRYLDDLTINALTLALNEPSALDCIDGDHLHASMSALTELSRLLHSFTMYEDSVRVGQIRPSVSLTHPSATSFANMLREMQVRVWTLQYTLLRDGIDQNQDNFPTAKEDLADYLRVVHYVLGARSYCKLSNKVFLKFMKVELLRLTATETWESDLAQVIFDLYGMKLSPNAADLQEHRCPADPLDRRTAIQIMDLVMTHVNRVNIKDLPKTDLKSVIDKMQQVIGAPKQTNALMLNKRLLIAFLKGPVNPIDLYRSLQGLGDLSAIPVAQESAIVATKGWYFLLGNMAFIRFCSQKRVAPGPTDDLNFASYFFKLDLECSMDKWETWYRLALVYDAQLEEDVLWSAEKLNNQDVEIIDLQRSAIHCYTMAVATAVRYADTSCETASKISDLYTSFGFRIYASSREPFSMEAFSLDDFTRHFSGQTQGMYKNRPFRDLKLYPAWKLAAVLFRKATVDKPQRWINHYMHAKCLWKMYSCEDSISRNSMRPHWREVLNTCVEAIEALPGRKDNRQEPILEPHYKLITIVHKLVDRRELQPLAASNFLQATPYARKIPPCEEMDAWESYILQVLKVVRTADKANWHHRMVARAAHVIYDESASDVTAAMGAKHEFSQQIFTKTMSLQVWKPEHERAGRHYVYTSRYVSFFVRLLVQLGDRASLEALTKRVRRKSGDYVGFAKIWQDMCLAYLKLLRRLGQIPEGYEDMVFKSITHEDFQIHAGRLESWCHQPDTYSPIIDILRDVIELKKLNNNLMKPTLIDDLIADIYAMLYGAIVPELAAKASGEESRERMRVDHLLMTTDDSIATPPPPATITSDVAVARPRTKGVGRKELQRRAEAAVTRPLALPETSKVSGTGDTHALQQPLQGLLSVKEEQRREDAQGLGSSAPGSVHDSADDESELSEIEEEPVPVIKPPMFPNLLNSGASTGPTVTKDEGMDKISPQPSLRDSNNNDAADSGVL